MKIYSFRPAEKIDASLMSKYHITNLPLVSILPQKPGITELTEYDSIAFLSSSAAMHFFLHSDIKIPEDMAIFAVGKKTAQEIPVKEDRIIIPPIHDSTHVAEKIIERGSKRVLVPRGGDHTDAFEKILNSAHITIREIVVYTYGKGEGQDLLTEIEFPPDNTVLLFTSPMEVEIFHEITGQKFLNLKTVPLGNPTLNALKSAGFVNILKGKYGDFQSMIQEVSKNSGEWI